MRSLIYLLTIFAVVCAAHWAYRENYATQAALEDAAQKRVQIRRAHARLAVLRAEWAYLNRPDRLRELADLNFERLGLLPFRADQFGTVGQVSYPRDPFADLSAPIEVSHRPGDSQ